VNFGAIKDTSRQIGPGVKQDKSPIRRPTIDIGQNVIFLTGGDLDFLTGRNSRQTHEKPSP
jgi:hypothetical protein